MVPMTPAVHVDPDFEQEFPGTSASATEASANLMHTASLLLDEVNRHRSRITRLSPSACQTLAVLDGAGEPSNRDGRTDPRPGDDGILRVRL
jgi:hypothetical protein